jgi:DNA-binding NtrC family response regulator/predicted ATPase
MTLHPVDRLVGHSPAVAALRRQIRHLATFDTVGQPSAPTLLLQGETGTGKGLVARVVHDSGGRAAGPFIDVNCGAIPEHLMEAELYGFEAGAFTDARRAKPGLFEAASRGTLFLDEIDTLPLSLQAKLLTSIEDRRVRRLGAVADLAVDVKVIAAVQAPLNQRVAEGRFRADLYHRLAVVILEIPPLRQRGDDVILLAQHFIDRHAAAHGVAAKRLEVTAAEWLRTQQWAGNVRELNHLMERVVLLAPDHTIDADALQALGLPPVPLVDGPDVVRERGGADAELDVGRTAPGKDETRIREAIAATGGNVVQAARRLGLSRNALRYRMTRYGIGQRSAGRRPSRVAGMADAGPVEPPPEMASALWEKKPVAVLAIELTFPTLGTPEIAVPEPWTLARRWEQVVAEKVQGFGGLLLQRTPSLFTALVGIPRALDRMPERAVHAALAVRHLVAEAAEDRKPDPPVSVRLGVHLGEVLLDVSGPFTASRLLAVGDALALPVRLLGMADPGEILVSSRLQRAIERGVVLEARALPAGASDRDAVYSVQGLTEVRRLAAEPGLTPFIGREREFAELERVLTKAVQGRGQVMAIVGEAGVGKSRLCAEFSARVGPQCLILAIRTPYPGRPPAFLPLIELLKRTCGIESGDDETTRRQKITDRVRRVDERLEDAQPYLWALLGLGDPASAPPQMDPDLRRGRTLEALKRLLLRHAVIQPVLLVVEDLQWLDDETLAFLDVLVEGLPEAPLLLLVTYRPEHQHGWGGRSVYTQLRLDPLGPREAETLLAALVEDATGLTRLILDKAQGNPFFLEEIVHALTDQGVLARDPRDPTAPAQPDLARSVAEFELPPTIQGVLAARIDGLPADERALLQTLAVLGSAFPHTLVARVADRPDAELRELLARLQTAEFIYERPGGPEPTYVFKHPLTQDVAYASLAGEHRQRLHRRTAEAIEALFAAQREDYVSVLAHHYQRAGMMERAVEYLGRAGQQAVQRSAYRAAIAQFTTALELVATLSATPERSRRTWTLQNALGAALMATRGLAAPEVERVFTAARALSGEVGDTPELFQVLQGLSVFYALRGRLRTAEELVEQRRRLAQRLQHPAFLPQAHIARGHILLALGELTDARAEFERGSVLYDPRQHHTLAFGSGLDPSGRDHAALVLWLLGYPDQALASLERALGLVQERPHPFSLAVVQVFAAMLHQFRGEAARARHWAEAALPITTEHGFHLFRGMAAMLRGWALFDQGVRDEGMGQLTQGFETIRATGAELLAPYFLGLVADAQCTSGRAEEGLATLDRAVEIMRANEEYWWEAEVLRLRAETRLQGRSTTADAEEGLRTALAVARHRRAKSLELRVATSLARLWQRQGRRDEARDLVGATHGWFTEGFDTPDLQRSKSLLVELGAS